MGFYFVSIIYVGEEESPVVPSWFDRASYKSVRSWQIQRRPVQHHDQRNGWSKWPVSLWKVLSKGMVATSEALWPLHALALPSVWKLITSERSERRRQKQGCLVLGLRVSLVCVLLCSKSPRPARFEGEGNELHLSVGGWGWHTFMGKKGIVFGD